MFYRMDIKEEIANIEEVSVENNDASQNGK